MPDRAVRAAHYRLRAQEMRVIAMSLEDKNHQDKLIQVAGDYERMAREAEGQLPKESTAQNVSPDVMKREMVVEHLTQAERHVREGERHIARQTDLVAELGKGAHDTTQAKALLTTFEELQTMHVTDRDRLKDQLDAIDAKQET